MKRVWQYYGFVVLRLVRMAYGPFKLGHLQAGMVEEVPRHTVAELLRGRLPLDAVEGSEAAQRPRGDAKRSDVSGAKRRTRRERWAGRVPRLSVA